jgi:hypothetical protein
MFTRALVFCVTFATVSYSAELTNSHDQLESSNAEALSRFSDTIVHHRPCARLRNLIERIDRVIHRVESDPSADIVDIVFSLDGDGVASATAILMVLHRLDEKINADCHESYQDLHLHVPLCAVVDVFSGCGSGAIPAVAAGLGIPLNGVIPQAWTMARKPLVLKQNACCLACCSSATALTTEATSRFFGLNPPRSDSLITGEFHNYDAINLSRGGKDLLNIFGSASLDDQKSIVELIATESQDSIVKTVADAIAAKNDDAMALVRKWKIDECVDALCRALAISDSESFDEIMEAASHVPNIPSTTIAANKPKRCSIAEFVSLVRDRKSVERDIFLVNISAEVSDVPCVFPSLTFDSFETANNFVIISANFKIVIPSKFALSKSKTKRASLFASLELAADSFFCNVKTMNTAQIATSQLIRFFGRCNCRVIDEFNLIEPGILQHTDEDESESQIQLL